jgi:ribulose-5-phosphate 4-epimerase/fuculose-1-phosphate aldolase
MAISHLDLRQAVVDGANFLVRVGAVSMSHHGNFSVRVPNTDTILLTATSSFDNLKPENLTLLDLEGRLLEGEINPTNAAGESGKEVEDKAREFEPNKMPSLLRVPREEDMVRLL